MSSPLVAGTAALLRGLYPKWTVSQVQDRILATVRPVSASLEIGDGRLDVGAAVGAPTSGGHHYVIDRSPGD